MKNAVKNTEAMVVVSQENMLEKLKHSEVTLALCSWVFRGQIWLCTNYWFPFRTVYIVKHDIGF